MLNTSQSTGKTQEKPFIFYKWCDEVQKAEIAKLKNFIEVYREGLLMLEALPATAQDDINKLKDYLKPYRSVALWVGDNAENYFYTTLGIKFNPDDNNENLLQKLLQFVTATSFQPIREFALAANIQYLEFTGFYQKMATKLQWHSDWVTLFNNKAIGCVQLFSQFAALGAELEKKGTDPIQQSIAAIFLAAAKDANGYRDAIAGHVAAVADMRKDLQNCSKGLQDVLCETNKKLADLQKNLAQTTDSKEAKEITQAIQEKNGVIHSSTEKLHALTSQLELLDATLDKNCTWNGLKNAQAVAIQLLKAHYNLEPKKLSEQETDYIAAALKNELEKDPKMIMIKHQPRIESESPVSPRASEESQNSEDTISPLQPRRKTKSSEESPLTKKQELLSKLKAGETGGQFSPALIRELQQKQEVVQRKSEERSIEKAGSSFFKKQPSSSADGKKTVSPEESRRQSADNKAETVNPAKFFKRERAISTPLPKRVLPINLKTTGQMSSSPSSN